MNTLKLNRLPLRSLIAASTLVGLAALGGCDKKPKAQANTIPDHWTQQNPADRGPGSLDPSNPGDPTGGPTTDPPQGRTGGGKLARRISVDQLRGSIPALFGGITWSVPRGGNQPPALQFEALSRTLGEADYVQATENNLEPSSLFAKFMDDMAGDLCKKAIDRDKDRAAPPGTEKLIIHNETDVDANLRWMRLKFHGIHVPESSTAGIEELRRLYDDVLSDTAKVEDAWYGVCVAVLTAPEFMAY